MTLLDWIGEAKKDVVSHLSVDLFVGVGFLVCGPHRTKSASFNPAKAVWHTSIYPMRVWGLLLAVLGMGLIAACVTGRQDAYDVARWALSGFWGFWAGLFIAGLINGDSSPLIILNIFWFIRTIRLPRDCPWRRIQLSQ